MSDYGSEGSPEQEASPLVVAGVSQSDDESRASVISLGERSHGLTGLQQPAVAGDKVSSYIYLHMDTLTINNAQNEL